MTVKYKFYEVGGKVRDELLGIKSKDVDYSVVIEDHPYEGVRNYDMEAQYHEFCVYLRSQGFEIYQEHIRCFTVRALFPKDHKYSGVADFVLARKEYYETGNRTPICGIGTLEDDLKRRDFTVNALAKDEDDNIVDLFNGREDLKNRILDTPIDPIVSFRDDPLRILRLLRFCVTKEMSMAQRVKDAIKELSINDLEVVSVDRIRDELNKSLNFDTYKTLQYVAYFETVLFYPLGLYVFGDGKLRLEATSKKTK